MSGFEVFGAVASLAGVFTSCVDCFEYIQISRRFDEDYQRSMLKLDIAANRLTRWGEAVGLCDLGFAMEISPKEMKTAESTLSEILSLFQKLQEKSGKFAAKAKSEDLVVYSPEVDLDPLVGPLHKRLKGLAISRQERSKGTQKSVRLVKKVSWALYEKDRFEVLIADVRSLVDDLIEMLPERAVTSQRRIATTKVSEITDPAAVQLLMDVTGEDDPLLKEVTKAAVDERNDHLFEENETTGKAQVRMGDEYSDTWSHGAQKSGHVYRGNKASDEAKVQYGNRYGGKSIFDD